MITLIAGLLPLAQPAAADHTLVFSTSSVEPWGIFSDDYQPGGLLVEFNNALQNEIKRISKDPVSFINHIRPYPRVINDIRIGRADFAVLFDSPESRNFGDSLGELATFQILVTGRKDAQPITSLDQLIDKRIGYIRGSKYGTAFDSHPYLSKVALDSMDKGLEMLFKGRLDVLICLDQTLFYAMKKSKTDKEQLRTLMVLGEARADLFISKRSLMQYYIDDVSSALRTLHSSGTIEKIFNHNRPL